MIRLKGDRDNTFKYRYQEYDFHEDKNYPGRRYVCAGRTTLGKCPVSALVRDDVVRLSSEHNHIPPITHITRPATRRMKELAKEHLHTSPRLIINDAFNE
ncbi:hypothetical protein PV325_011544 [Microctonus aethiopoides]|uniref:FLYWCH-type domain-containing protein n=1 Tax=Microctonus aethiopoides TaxID=144406 RepID=A0AA39ESG5_9HYME|nr:hypothetical protein PV325_011544 [Microctonus aethiopoides]KAK0072718.1 hypothetical protein PV326_014166 [Microctonus aethiopoides]KAK0157127.1 hypothetical protein PV328_011851 [Microctonus aethiopoides]